MSGVTLGHGQWPSRVLDKSLERPCVRCTSRAVARKVDQITARLAEAAKVWVCELLCVCLCVLNNYIGQLHVHLLAFLLKAAVSYHRTNSYYRDNQKYSYEQPPSNTDFATIFQTFYWLIMLLLLFLYTVYPPDELTNYKLMILSAITLYKIQM